MIWETRRLDEIARVVDSLHRTPKYQEFGLPMVRAVDIRNSYLDLSEALKVSDAEFAAFNSNHTPGVGDILLSRVGVYRRVAYVKTAEKFCLGQNTVVITGHKSPYFLYCCLRSPFVKEQIESLVGGGAQPTISLASIRSLEVPDPDFDTVKKIESILLPYDDLIYLNDQRIKVLEKTAHLLYKEWFIDFKFFDHENVEIVDSENSNIGRIPKICSVQKMGNLVSIRKGKNITSTTVCPGNVPVIAGGLGPAYYHNESNTEKPVITISASGANAGYVGFHGVNIWASDCSVIDASSTNTPHYFYLLLKSIQVEITRLQTGAAQPHVYPKDLAAIEVISFPNELIATFERIVEPIFSLVFNLREQNNVLANIRDHLLPKLISGEIDVSKSADFRVKELVAEKLNQTTGERTRI